MPTLRNNRRENFCLGVAKGLTATQAYREAGYRGQGHVGESGASELMRKPEVIARITELRQRQVRRLDVTVDSLVADLDEMLRLATECENPSAGVSAIMGKAKLLGLIADRAGVGTMIRKPAREATDKKQMSLEEWQAKFAPTRH